MCISIQELDKRVISIREFKSIKKEAESNLKPLENDVKDFMKETGVDKYTGYGYSISYVEQERESVDKDKVLELLNNPRIQEVILSEGINISGLFKTTIVRPLRIS